MSRAELLRDIRSTFDNLSPGWQDSLRKHADARCPGWTHVPLRVRWKDGTETEVALLANPEPVSRPSDVED